MKHRPCYKVDVILQRRKCRYYIIVRLIFSGCLMIISARDKLGIDWIHVVQAFVEVMPWS